MPFLPVTFDQVELHWPTAQGTRPVSAPLTAYQPISLDASVPCATMRALAASNANDSGVVFATTPPNGAYASVTGMSVQVHGTGLTVLDNGTQLAATTIPGDATVPAGARCALAIHSDGTATTVNLAGQTIANVAKDVRPQVTGIYSDLTGAGGATSGLSVTIQPDDRFQSSATVLKIAVMALAILALIGAMLALHRMDVRASDHRLRLAPKGWWRPTWLDIAVIGILLAWWLIGAGTSDDGYILTMARDEATDGYIGNIYRWFNSPEAPFGWFYELYARWVLVSTATPWVRLPALLMGISSWALLSREVLPRLGTVVRRSKAAGWAAAGGFLAFWLPYDNGLRPESVVVLWTLLAICAVERTLANRRLLPAAAGLFAAAFAVAATPTGLIAIGPFLAGAVSLLRLLRQRAQRFGWVAVLAPLTAAGTIVLLAVFVNQTFRSVIDSTTIREGIGPAESWYQETDRYEALFTITPDGSLERRFPVLLLIFCVLTCIVVLLRRGRIPGAALGPSRRLIGISMMSFALLALTPTKWTHHFGAFAALGGAMAALTALATSASVLRSRRNRALFTAGLLFVAAIAATGPNAWYYTGNWGSPWYNMPPTLLGHHLASLLLVLAIAALVVAGIEHVRANANPPPPGRNRLRWASAPVAIVCMALVLAEVVNFVKVIEKQGPAYSLGKDNVQQLADASCGVSDYTYVETDPAADILAPHGSVPALTGFQRGNLPTADGTIGTTDPGGRLWLPPFSSTGNAGTVWSDYGAQRPSTLQTGWYTLPARAHQANSVLVTDVAGSLTNGNTVSVQFAKQTASGDQVLSTQQFADVPAGEPDWRELRLALTGPAQGADEIRLLANGIGPADPSNWLAVTAPRVPAMTQMTALVGNQPTFIEWISAQGYPCLRPFGTTDGVSEMPAYWVSGGETFDQVGSQWSGSDYGGPFGWINVAATVRILPTYLKDDLTRDWGSLYAIDPDVPQAAPASSAMTVQRVTHWGWYSPGANSVPISTTGSPVETGSSNQ